jgi:hypothetical protein
MERVDAARWAESAYAFEAKKCREIEQSYREARAVSV